MSSQGNELNRVSIHTEYGEIDVISDTYPMDEETQNKVKIVNRATAFGQLYIALIVLLNTRVDFVQGVLEKLRLVSRFGDQPKVLLNVCQVEFTHPDWS